MADVVTAKYNFIFEALEIIDMGLDQAADQTFAHVISGLSASLSSSTTPAPTIVTSDNLQVGIGATVVLDLTAAVGPTVHGTGITKDLTGDTPILSIWAAHADNPDTITVGFGALTPCHIFGDGAGQVTIPPGGIVMMFLNAGVQAIDAVNFKHIDITNDDAGATADIQYIILAKT